MSAQLLDSQKELDQFKANHAQLESQVIELQSQLEMKEHVSQQMDNGFVIFKRLVENEEALRRYKQKEGYHRGALINSAEQLSVRLD